MKPFSAEGSFSDRHGTERVDWEFVPYAGPSRWMPSFTIRATIRGAPIWGFDLENLGLDQEACPDSPIEVDTNGNLNDCMIRGTLPIMVRFDGQLSETCLYFDISIPPTPDRDDPTIDNRSMPPNTTLSLMLDVTEYRSRNEWFEDCFVALLNQLPNTFEVESCWTCLYSDISPGGYSGIGMNCHRGVKEQYLAVRSKSDYWQVPVTEEVPQTYRCPEWSKRIPGTGYRG